MFSDNNQEIFKSQEFVHGLHIENVDENADALSVSGCIEKLILSSKTNAYFQNVDKVRNDLFAVDCHLTVDQRSGSSVKSVPRKYFVDCTEFLITLIRPVVSLEDVALFDKYDCFYPKDFIYYSIRELFHRAYDLHNVYTTTACAALVKRLGLIYDLCYRVERNEELSPTNYLIEFVRVLGGDVLVTDTSLGFYRTYTKIENEFCDLSAQARQSGFWSSALNLFTSWFSGAKCDVDPQAQGIETQVIGPHYVNGEGKEIDGYYMHTDNPEVYAVKTLYGFAKDHEEAQTNVCEAQAETKGFFSGIVSSCSRLIHSFVSGTTEMTNKIVSKIRDFTNLFTNFDVSYLNLIKYGAISLVAVVIITLLLTLINTGILTHAYLSRKRVLDAQDKDNSSFITGVCRIVAAVTGWSMGAPIARINSNMSFAGTFGRSVEAVTKWMLALMPIAVLKCFGISNECLEVFSENQALADDLLSKTSIPGVTQLPGYIESLKKLLYYFREVYMSEKEGGKYPKNYYRQASYYVKTISKKLAEIQGVRYHNTIKNPSLLVYVSGDTGVAKSTLFHQLMGDASFTGKLKTCTSEPVAPRVYNRTAEDEYWSGYQPKTYGCTVIDEAFNMSDADLYKIESQVLHLTGAAAYLLPMADISDSAVGKKGTGYDSNITVLIGNTTAMSSESYHRDGCYTSLTRRVNCEIHVRIAPEYKRFYSATKGLDLEGLRKHLLEFKKYSPSEVNNRLARYEHAEFVVRNFDLKGKVEGKTMTYAELKDELIRRHNEMTKSVSRLVDFSGYVQPFDVLDGLTKAFVEENRVEMLEKSVRIDPTKIGFKVEPNAKAENFKYNDLECVSFNKHEVSMDLLQYCATQREIPYKNLPPYESTIFTLARGAMRNRKLKYETEFDLWNRVVEQLDLAMRAFIGAPTTVIRIRVLRSIFWILSPWFKDFAIYTEKEFEEYKPLLINYCYTCTKENLDDHGRDVLKNYKNPPKTKEGKGWQLVWYKIGSYYISRIYYVPIEKNGWIAYKCLNECYACVEKSIDTVFGLYDIPEGKHLKPLEYIDRIAYRLKTKFAIDLYSDLDPIGDGEDTGTFRKIANAAIGVVGVAAGFAAIFYAAKKIVTAFTTWFADDNKELAQKEFECQDQQGYDYKRPGQPDQQRRNFDYGYDYQGGNLWYQGDGLQTVRLRVDGHEINTVKVYEKWVLTYSHSRFRHLLDGTAQSLEVTFKVNEKDFSCQVTPAHIRTAGPDPLINDILFVKIDAKQFTPAATNVWKKFVPSDALYTLSESARFPVKVTTVDNRRMYSFGSIVDSIPYAGPDKLSYVLDHGVRYNMNTRDGDCGTPVIGLVAGKHSVIGIHVAGNEFDEVGVCNIVTQNTLKKVLEIPVENDDDWVVAGKMQKVGKAGIVDLNAQSDELPNLLSVERLPKHAASFQPKENSMVKTMFADNPAWYPMEKAPSLPMDAVCADGTNVKDVMIREMGEFRQPPKLDDDILDRIFREAVIYYKRQVQNTGIAWRKFDPDAAVKGTINLAPMDMNTSPGYPWNKLKPGCGKRGCINHVEGQEILYNLEYYNCLQETLQVFDSDGSIEDVPFGNIFICNWKQELLKLSKILSGRTRSINCASLHLSHAMRMHFGCLLEMLNNMKGESAIGLDPHSPEFHNRVYVHLCRARPEGKGFIAGDYKAFDKHYVREILDLAFEVLHELVPEGFCTEEQWKFFKDSQTNPKLIIGNKMYKFDTLQYSGCLLTTCLNNLINRLYISYCYYRLMGVNTKQSFDRFVTGIYMGDDHLLYVKPAVREVFNQVSLSTAMLELNQEYTDDKKSAVAEPFQEFGDCTFMGCTPKLIGNVYYGALRKTTLQNNVTYIQNGESLLTILDGFVCHAAVWGREYFDEYVAKVKKVLPDFRVASYESCLRTFTRKINLKAQSGSPSSYLKAQSDEIVEFVDEEEGEAEETEEMLVPVEIDSTALADTNPQDYHTGMNSWLLKGVFSWDSSQQRGTVLYQTATSEPWSLLSLNAHDLQSLGVRNFQYWRGTVEIKFTLNCVPSQGGAIIVSSYPLAEDVDAYTGINSTLYMPHGILSPVDKSTSYVISHPFTYPMPYAECNIDAKNVNYPVLFKISARVLSQLTGSAPNATLSVYMRIKDCELKVPRNPELSNLVAQSMDFKPLQVPDVELPALPDSPREEVEKPKPKRPYRFYKKGPRNRGYSSRRGFGKGHGNKGAKKKVEKPAPTVPDKGSMPTDVNNQQEKELAKEGKYKSEKKGSKFYPSRKLRKELAGLDQDKVKGALKKVGGGLFYKAANTVLKNKTGISLDELLNLFNAFDREKIIELTTHIQYQYQSISNGVGPFKVTSFQLNPNADYHLGRALIAPEDVKISELTSPFCFFKFFNWSTTNTNESTVAAFPLRSDLGYIADAGNTADVPMNMAFIHSFMYFKCTFVFRVYVFKSCFHSGRLRATVGYGINQTQTEQSQGITYSHILDFTNNYMCEFEVPFRIPTEWMVTYGGPQPYLKYMIEQGWVVISVANSLVNIGETTSSSVECAVAVSYKDCCVAVPRPVPLCTGNTNDQRYYLTAQDMDEHDAEQEEDAVVECNHFEFQCDDMLTYWRRLYQYPEDQIEVTNLEPVNNITPQKIRIVVRPWNMPMSEFFNSFSGSLNFRVVFYNNNEMRTTVKFFPFVTSFSHNEGVQVKRCYGAPTEIPCSQHTTHTLDFNIPYQKVESFLTKQNAIFGVIEISRSVLTAYSSVKPQVFMGLGDDAQFGMRCVPTGGVVARKFPKSSESQNMDGVYVPQA